MISGLKIVFTTFEQQVHIQHIEFKEPIKCVPSVELTTEAIQVNYIEPIYKKENQGNDI